MRKRYVVALMAAAMTVGSAMTSFAGWQSDANGWWWQNEDGSYPSNTWQWLDGNGDGVAESYYFGPDGYMYANTTTPDGYTVNADGAWTVNGVVQTQGSATDNSTGTSAYDSQYPLAGMLDQLGLNFAKNSAGIDLLYWSTRYQQDAVGFDQANNTIWNKAKETNNLNYWNTPVDYTTMLAIAKLANVSINLPYANEEQAEAIANNIREFFNSFPNWKNASDYEKACHIARWIEQAEYYNDTENVETPVAYQCLVEKKTNCAGYTITAKLLAQCVGLQAITGQTSVQNHIYPVFNINGVWLSYDASYNGTEQSFRIHDVYEYVNYPIHQGIDFNTDYPGNTYKYFQDRGYVVPTSLRDKFDASIIGSETDWQGTRDTLKLR